VELPDRDIQKGTGPIHTVIVTQPRPTVQQMAITKAIWQRLPSHITSQFRVPPTGVNSRWINAAAHAMEESLTVNQRTQIGINVANTWPHSKLRILAAWGYIGRCWWLREALVWTLVQLPLNSGLYKVDDAESKAQWDYFAMDLPAHLPAALSDCLGDAAFWGLEG
jgi:hypothetical protein